MSADELGEALRCLYEAGDEALRARFYRSLSFADGHFDRWERAKRLGFGDGASIYNSALIYGDVTVGAQSWIGPYVLLDGSGGGLSIGRYCSISAGVQIYTHDTVAWALSGGTAEAARGAVAIGDNCYIGSQSIVARGVTIGQRCVVAANSYVNSSVENDQIVGGSPAKPLGRVEVEGTRVTLVYADGHRVPLNAN